MGVMVDVTMDLDVLLVDDDPGVLECIKTRLEQRGMRIRGVRGALAAAEEIGKSKPDLVLLDLNLPGVHGNEFLEWARDKPGLPIVLLTGAIGHLRDDLDNVPIGMLTKPLLMDDLQRIIERAGIVSRKLGRKLPDEGREP